MNASPKKVMKSRMVGREWRCIVALDVMLKAFFLCYSPHTFLHARMKIHEGQTILTKAITILFHRLCSDGLQGLRFHTPAVWRVHSTLKREPALSAVFFHNSRLSHTDGLITVIAKPPEEDSGPNVTESVRS